MIKPAKWQDESHYDYTNYLDKRGWAWEFLRRNNEYRTDYAKCVALEAHEESKHGPYSSDFLYIHTEATKQPHFMYHLPEKLDYETEREWFNRCLNQSIIPKLVRPSVWYARKWGIRRIADPDQHEDVPEFLYSQFPVFVSLYSELADDPNAPFYPNSDRDTALLPAVTATALRESLAAQGDIEGHSVHLVAFSLGEPIEDQIKHVRKLHQDLRERLGEATKIPETSTPKSTAWKNYIRVLDALLDGVTEPSKIAVGIGLENNAANGSAGTKTVHKWIPSALTLTKDYQKLLLSSYKPQSE